MSQELTREQWDDINRRLREPFQPRDVDFRVQGKANEQTGKAQVVAFIDARAVQERLDAVVGAGNWSFDWTPLVIDRGEVMVAKGVLTLYGISKADAGSASNFEQTLGAVSHCFKRAAVHWGIGRYLYNIEGQWVQVERGGRIPSAVLQDLRAKLPRPAQSDQSANAAHTRVQPQQHPASPAPHAPDPRIAQAVPAAQGRATGPTGASGPTDPRPNHPTTGPLPSNPLSLDRREHPAGEQEQRQLLEQLRQAFPPVSPDEAARRAAVSRAENFVFGVLERPVTMRTLADGEARLTVGEVQQVLRQLPAPTPAAVRGS